MPNDTNASRGRSGRASNVEGLSPVEGAIAHDRSKPYLLTKYKLMFPRKAPPSLGTFAPSLDLRLDVSLDPAANDKSRSSHVPGLIFHRFMPQTSEISRGAILPRKMEARKEDTKQIRDVCSYFCGCCFLNLKI